MVVAMKDRLVWIDCEMTGLDLRDDALIEIAALVTDGELNILDEGVDFVIKPPQGTIDRMSKVVRDMHTTSGLLDVLPQGIPLAEAEQRVLDYIRTHVPEANRAPLCGNSIATDRSFIARDMPALDAHLHYRMVDVSSVKELVRRWYPRIYFASPTKKGGHRALADITESITELRYYRAAAFVAQPGPDSEAAREMAAQVVAAEAIAARSPARSKPAESPEQADGAQPSRPADAVGAAKPTPDAEPASDGEPAGDAAGAGSADGAGSSRSSGAAGSGSAASASGG
jgi:oligoribonuclease